MPGSWGELFREECKKEYFRELLDFLDREYRSGKTINPPPEQIFRAFRLTPLEDVKVVILGQDPYPDPEAANGLAFSVNRGVTTPGSLRNIFREIDRDDWVAEKRPHWQGDLTGWAEQGVLLLNTALTVEAGKPRSHSKVGWETLTDRVIASVNEKRERPQIFVLWGNKAQEKEKLIDQRFHIILKAAHPSPLSANRGFFGCGHFSKINWHLKRYREKPIDWSK